MSSQKGNFDISLADRSIEDKSKHKNDWIDMRNIVFGSVIPTNSYSDQPYIVGTDDGAWLCACTTGAGHEGEAGQHIITLKSSDNGGTWTKPVEVEPPSGPEASYVVMLKVPSGRVYCFYNHNTDNIRKVVADNPPYLDGYCKRVDSLGYFVFKYSDDHGSTWSNNRYTIDVREMDIDRNNSSQGAIRYFWNVGKPFIHEGNAYVPLHKVGGFGYDFFTSSEGVLLKSSNLLTESDPQKITWETLPDGEIGLRAPEGGGPISEEHSFVTLSDGSFYCVYRTIDGHPVFTYSRDGGHTWDQPQYKRYADGRLMKHPRAANFVWKCAEGRYLYWFHNHGGRGYSDRNPVWVAGGVEADSPQGKIILWSQPEILLYDDDPYVRMSYPDLVIEDGKYYVTETQKNVARVHEIDATLLEGLWNQFKNRQILTNELRLVVDVDDIRQETPIYMPELPMFNVPDSSKADCGARDLRNGFSIDFWIKLDSIIEGQILVDNRTPDGKGFCIKMGQNGSMEITLSDGQTQNVWSSDIQTIAANTLHHASVIVDGGPKTIVFIIDGKVCDGGTHRQFGWGRFSPKLRHINGSKVLQVSKQIKKLRIYSVPIRFSQAIGNYRAEK